MNILTLPQKVKRRQLVAGSMSLISGSNTLDVTITAVDPNKTIIHAVDTGPRSFAGTGSIGAALLNSTTVRLYGNCNAAVSGPYSFYVVEFVNPFASPPQYVAQSAADVTISALNDYTTALVFLAGCGFEVYSGRPALTSATNLNWSGYYSYAASLRACICEFSK